MNNEVNPLGQERVSRLLFKFSLPAIVGMVVNSLYNVVDRIFIGNYVGPYGIAGITIGFPIMIILMSMGLLFGVGGATLFSIRLGEGKVEEAEGDSGQCLYPLGYCRDSFYDSRTNLFATPAERLRCQ